MPRVAGVGSVHFAFSVLNHGFWPQPLPAGPVAREAEAAEEEAGHQGRVRDLAAVGMIHPAGLAAVTLAVEIQTLDENFGMRWALPEDTPGRIGPFNPGIRRDRSGP